LEKLSLRHLQVTNRARVRQGTNVTLNQAGTTRQTNCTTPLQPTYHIQIRYYGIRVAEVGINLFGYFLSHVMYDVGHSEVTVHVQ